VRSDFPSEHLKHCALELDLVRFVRLHKVRLKQPSLLTVQKPALPLGLKGPVRLIWGSDDPFSPIAKARRMLSSFGGGADLHEIVGAKLYSHEDHPDEFVAAARPFLRAVLASPITADRPANRTA